MATPCAFRTFLAPGQRYADASGVPWRLEDQVTILRVDAVADAASLVVSGCPNGLVITAFAAQVEAAVAAGLLVPVAGDGMVGRC